MTPTTPTTPSRNLGITLPDDVVRRIDERAARERRTRSNMVAVLVLQALDAEEPMPQRAA
jgi:metal-responsive CopG/Arc/MetJ family transcriptional regulator